MEKRKLERLGVETSLLGYGCMRFPMTADGKIDEAEAEKLLDTALAAGINYIDTAWPYHNGESEPFVGKVLSKYPRDSYYLATKLPVWLVKSLDEVDTYLEKQLERLRTDHIDFYLMHSLDKEGWDRMVEMGTVKRLEELKAEGKIRYLGFSFHDKYEVFEEILNYRDWDFCQIQLNYMDTDIQAGLKGYELTAKKNIPLVIMEPVKGGTLASFSEDLEEEFHKLDRKASVASYALRWVGSLPNVKVILSGMSSMEQLQDNLATFADFKALSTEEKDTIYKVVAAIRARVQNGCTGCRYCMPCPMGVNIPGCFSAWNTYHMYRNYKMVSGQWENSIGEKGQPKNCIECGKCEKACPQKLPIREDLKKVQKDFDARMW